jgi:hypothetical protein
VRNLTSRISLHGWFWSFLLVSSFAGAALAQTAATGNIEGVVTDASGGVLPGVPVVVRNQDTNVVREAITNENGMYRAAALQPGSYEISSTLSGFTAKPVVNVVVQVGQTVSVDIRMQPQGVAETVSVVGDAPIIDVRRTDVSTVVDETAIQNLPINGRRWENFVMLSPGVTNDGNFGLVSYRGISGLYNNNTVDGVDNNQAFFSEARGRTRAVYTISQSAIREFQVGVSNFSAEFGRAAGGTVNAVTKTGTNQLRGEIFYFIRDDVWQAREFFQPEKPDERRQQFGASVGGPIRRDKIFFFANFDQQLRNFPYFVGTSSTTFLQQSCTAPGCAATRSYFESLQVFVPREGNNRIFLGKTDVALGPGNNLALQYNAHRWEAPNGVRTPAINFNAASDNGTDIVKTDFAVASLNTVLGTRWLNELRGQVGRDLEQQLPNAPGPSTTVTGGTSIGMPDFLPRQKFPDEQRFQIIDSVTYYAGAHNLKAGIDLNYVRDTQINLRQGGGVYSYADLQRIAADCPADAAGCVELADATPRRHYSSFTQAFDLRGLQGDVFFTTMDYNAFVQDTWTATNRLTLYVGLRYEYQRLPQPGETEVDGIPFSGNPDYPLTQRFNQDKNNWGPRLGLTYDLGGQRTTVLRGGYGLYYGRTSNSAVSSALTNNAVTFASYFFTPSTAGAPQYPNVLTAPPTAPGSVSTIQFFASDLERPEIHMVDFSVDRAVTSDITVSASYLFSRGRKLPTFVDTNLPAPNSQVKYVLDGQELGTFPAFRGVRPDSRVGAAIEVRSDVESTYHGLVLQANKRFSNGLLFNTNYTLSRATDTGQNSVTFIGSFSDQVNPFDLESEKGTSDFDRRHRFVASFHYAPNYLRGVQVGGIITAESGLPIDPQISGSAPSGAPNTSTTNGSGGDRRAPFLERNSFRQPGRQTFDARVSKEFRLQGNARAVVLWEVFNVFNRTNFSFFSQTKYRVPTGGATFDPATNTSTINLTEDTGFLRPSSASNAFWGPRDMQLGLKLLW